MKHLIQGNVDYSMVKAIRLPDFFNGICFNFWVMVFLRAISSAVIYMAVWLLNSWLTLVHTIYVIILLGCAQLGLSRLRP